MRYPTKFLFVFLYTIEVRVLAAIQFPKNPTVTTLSENCYKALTIYFNSSPGRDFERCITLMDEGKSEEVCRSVGCLNVDFPDDIRAQCQSDEDKLDVSLLVLAAESYNEKMRVVCKVPNKPVVNTTRPSAQPTKAPSTQSNKNAQGNQTLQTTKSVQGNQSTQNNLGTKSVQGNQSTQNNLGTKSVQGAQSAQPNQDNQETYSDSQAYPQYPQVTPIDSSNYTPANLDLSSSTESKLTYSLIITIALAAFNLLL